MESENSKRIAKVSKNIVREVCVLFGGMSLIHSNNVEKSVGFRF